VPEVISQKILQDLSSRVTAMLAASPIEDIEKNVKAAVTGSLARLDLVTREEFDVQAQVLAHTREQLQALEQRLAALEK
jgi:BMFP domain-containing protein YqiC